MTKKDQKDLNTLTNIFAGVAFTTVALVGGVTLAEDVVMTKAVEDKLTEQGVDVDYTNSIGLINEKALAPSAQAAFGDVNTPIKFLKVNGEDVVAFTYDNTKPINKRVGEVKVLGN